MTASQITTKVIVSTAQAILIPPLFNASAIWSSAIVSPAFGKMNDHQFSEKCMWRDVEITETVDMAQNQIAKRLRKMPAGTPMAFQISPIDADPRKSGDKALDASIPRVTRVFEVYATMN